MKPNTSLTITGALLALSPKRRVNEVMTLLDCTYLTQKRGGGFSKGMRQWVTALIITDNPVISSRRRG